MLAVCLTLSCTACNKNSMSYIIDNMPSFKGVVTEFCEGEYIVVDTNADLKKNETYDNYKWILVRKDGGDWSHVDHGY